MFGTPTEAANLPEQGTQYSVTSYIGSAYVNFELPTFNSSYSGYQVNFTISTGATSLVDLTNITFTSNVNCLTDGSVRMIL